MNEHGWARRYQFKLQSKYKKITNACGFIGSVMGLGLWLLTVNYIFSYYGFELSKGDKQFTYPYLFAFMLIMALILYTFIMSFVCHIPFVLYKVITVQEAFQAVFLWRHPRRWLK